MKKTWILFFLAALITVASLGCGNPPPSHSSGGEEEHHDESNESEIHLSVPTQEAVGLTFAKAQMKPLERTLHVTGQVAQDTDLLAHVSPPAPGELSELLVGLGDRVEKGTPVAIVRAFESDSPQQVLAPQSGLVIGVHAKPGEKVDTLSSLLSVADLSLVWATFDVYEKDIGLVQVGQKIDVTSVAYPDRSFSGEVVFVSPRVDQHTRTIKVRAKIGNPDYSLKLGMFVTGLLHIPTVEQGLILPHVSVQTVEGKSVVFVQKDPETFEMRKVLTGYQNGIWVQMTEGLKEGETVVAEGSYHLKAQLLKSTLEEGHAH